MVIDSPALVENTDVWEWVQKIRSPSFDSCLNTTKQNSFPLLYGCEAAGSQSNSLLGWFPGTEETLGLGRSPCIAHTETFLCLPVISDILYMAGNHRQIDCILVVSSTSPGKNQFHAHLLEPHHQATIYYLEHKMEEFHKSQAIILSYEMQPHEASAKPSEEIFLGSLPKSYTKPITIFCQYFKGWYRIRLKMNILKNNFA